ncbi:BTAD domain-containing putative transcriptional regulator [Rhodococcus sp. NPDC003382]|uniref:BTAD domain-containing putative transcriptional regulator n=1 Tax=Rhodococcus sp. HM1 TaxID=2937759 RepID=UPI00200A67E2|nr:BTAD domain-containing putative transcriptional regulator [Rhodococcus sp. HM1]MCK8669748.1 AAA family ATPase [Rhodococcus sp. HM1]
MTAKTPSAGPVRISVLGSTEVTVCDRMVSLGGPGARAVLGRLLVASGQVVSTDLLIEDLWSGGPPPKALAALQVHVSNLRRLLEPARAPRTPATVIVSAPPGYALRLPTEAVDAWHFDRLVTEGLTAADRASRIEILSQALDRWKGIPYHEHLDADWARVESARLMQVYATALEARAHAYLDEGRVELAADQLDPHVAEHPEREFAVRLLASAQYRCGRQADALATLRRTREYLLDELGVDPSPELQQLERDILQQRPSLSPERADIPLRVESSVPQQHPDSGDIVGRDGELAQLYDAAHRSETNGLHLVWIAGDAGEGKSALARAFLHRTTAEGRLGAWGGCPEVDGAPPAWPWTEILRGLGGQEPPASPFELSRALEHLLSRPEQTTVLVLDDVHRADEPTLQVLRHVAASARDSATLVVATFRPSEVTDDLRATWAATAGIPGARITLHGVGREEARTIARRAGSADLDEDVLIELVDRTGGNPLFLEEYCRLIASEGVGTLGTPPGVGAVRATVPDGVRNVLARRISRLPERTVVALRRGAVLGRDFDLSVLGAVSDMDDESVIDALEPAVVTGILVEPAPDRLRFSHDLVREALYDALPAMRRRRIHAAALDMLARRDHSDPTVLAHHAIAAATPATAERCAEYVVAGARAAERQSSFKDAFALWAAARSLSETASEPNSRLLLEILIGQVGSQARTGDIGGARDTRVRAVRAARALGDRDSLVRALVSWTAPVVWTIRVDPEPDTEILDEIDTALADPALPTATRALLLVAKVFELEGLDDAGSLAAAVEARTLAQESGDPTTMMRALNAVGYVAFGPDLVDERLGNSRQLLDVAQKVGDEGFVSVAHFQRFLAATAVTDFDQAYESASVATTYAAGHQLVQMLGVLAVFDAMVELMAGRVESGLRRYDEISATMHAQGMVVAQWIGTIGRIGVAVARGDLSPLVEELELIEGVRPHSVRFPLILALLDRGDTDRARQLWEGSRPYPRDYYWLAMTTFRARVAARLADAATARELHAQLLPFSGRIAGLDSGSFYAGPVDVALAETAEAVGDGDAAARWRAAASELVTRLAERLHDARSPAPSPPADDRSPAE